jgi:hypothetical protein
LQQAAFLTQAQKPEAATAAAAEIQELRATCVALRHRLDHAQSQVQ